MKGLWLGIGLLVVAVSAQAGPSTAEAICSADWIDTNEFAVPADAISESIAPMNNPHLRMFGLLAKLALNELKLALITRLTV